MLQLPTPTLRVKRFSKTEIADMSQGAKVRVKAKPRKDPIIAMIARADRLLFEYTGSVNDACIARDKLPKEDQGRLPAIYIPDDLINVAWGIGHPFNSLKQIDTLFSCAIKATRQRLTDNERLMSRHIRGTRKLNWPLDVEQAIASEKRAIKLLRKHREPMKVALRKEDKRLRKAQNLVGLVAARRRVFRSFYALQKVTKEIAKSKPQTIDGALAAAGYVERRLWCDKPDCFRDDGDMPGHFGQLMRAALVIIRASALDGHHAGAKG